MGLCSGQGQHLGIAVVGIKESLIGEGFLEEATVEGEVSRGTRKKHSQKVP